MMNVNEMILRFFRDDIGGILITGTKGEIIYADEQAGRIYREAPSWKAFCPPKREGQKKEIWDLPAGPDGKSYMVITSSFQEKGELFQIHHFVENNVYMELYRDISSYSRTLKEEKERDGLTGLYNKGKFLELKRTLFRKQKEIAVFNFDVNNLKTINDTRGHEAGDRLILKAAESLRKIESRNVFVFRVGGDEFIAVALHVSAERADEIRQTWETALEAQNEVKDGIECIVACGMACGEKESDFESLLSLADQRMYADKKAKKNSPAGRMACAPVPEEGSSR